MDLVAPDLYELNVAELAGFPKNGVNTYLLRDVAVDAAVRPLAELLIAQLDGADVAAHAVTHGHMDHQGGSHALCEAKGVPFWAPALEAERIESGDILPLVPDNELNRKQIDEFGGPGHPVARRLREGDEVGGFVVLDTPGHSPGHISFWREADRVLVVGDVVSNMNAETFEVGLHEPFTVYTVDPEENRRSIRKLAALDPLVLAFGHGPVVRDPDAFQAFVESVPADPPA